MIHLDNHLDLYELDVPEPIGYVDHEGQVIWTSKGHPPRIVFADIPAMMHLSTGITVAPFDDGRRGWRPDKPDES